MSAPGRSQALIPGSPVSAVLKASPAAAHLATLGRGFQQPVHAAQQVFRAVLEAMSRPGRLQVLPMPALAGLEPPDLPLGLTAVLLSLLDAETSLWLAPPFASAQAQAYLAFHTGVRTQAKPQSAAFVVAAAAQAHAGLWSSLEAGTDEAPQSGSTLVVEVDALTTDDTDTATGAGAAQGLVLRGPGIADTQRLRVAGLPADFWRAREQLAPEYPRGIDLILCCGDAVAALPRTTRVAQEG